MFLGPLEFPPAPENYNYSYSNKILDDKNEVTSTGGNHVKTNGAEYMILLSCIDFFDIGLLLVMRYPIVMAAKLSHKL